MSSPAPAEPDATCNQTREYACLEGRSDLVFRRRKTPGNPPQTRFRSAGDDAASVEPQIDQTRWACRLERRDQLQGETRVVRADCPVPPAQARDRRGLFDAHRCWPRRFQTGPDVGTEIVGAPAAGRRWASALEQVDREAVAVQRRGCAPRRRRRWRPAGGTARPPQARLDERRVLPGATRPGIFEVVRKARQQICVGQFGVRSPTMADKSILRR